MSVAWPALLTFAFALFIVPGLLGATMLADRRVVPRTAVVLTAIAVSSALGYVVFWLYLADETLGRAVSVAIGLATVASVAVPAQPRRMLRRTVASQAVAVPLLLVLLVAVFYNGVLFAHGSATPVERRAQLHLRGGGLPVDNVLPAMFAERLYDGDDTRELYGDWKSSDRPPLQTGIVLVQLPMSSALDVVDLHYQLLGSALQCSWVPAVWALCGRRSRPRWIATAVAAGTFSGFFFLNSVFVWPKLLAGSLVVLLYVLMEDDDRPPAAVVVAAAAGALALLAHAGAVFTLLPLVAVVALRRPMPSGRTCVAGALAASLLLAPWQAYTRLYDPPGDRLAKWHLAGVVHIDDRSLAQSLADSYDEVGFSGAVANKERNLVALFGERPRWSLIAREDAEPLRTQEFFGVAWAFGAMNASWLLLAARPLRRRRARRDPQVRSSLRMLALGGAGVATWVLLMFGPATTVVHQGSYATMILLWVGLSGVAADRSGRWAEAIVAVQVAFFTAVWVRDLPGPEVPLHRGQAAVAAVAAVLVLVVLAWLGRRDRGGAVDRARPVVSPGSEQPDVAQPVSLAT